MANVIRSHWYSWWIHRTTFASQNFFFLSFKSKVGTTLLTQLCMMNSLLIKYVKHLNTRIMSLNGVWALSLVFDMPLIIEVLVPGELEVIYLRVRDSCFFSTMDRCPIWVEHSPKYIRWWHPKSKNHNYCAWNHSEEVPVAQSVNLSVLWDIPLKHVSILYMVNMNLLSSFYAFLVYFHAYSV